MPTETDPMTALMVLGVVIISTVVLAAIFKILSGRKKCNGDGRCDDGGCAAKDCCKGK